VRLSSCMQIQRDLRRTESVPRWELSRPYDSTGPAPAEIRYGVTPPGYISRRSAEPLTPGCYRISASLPGASGSLDFWVRVDGSVAALSEAERDSVQALGARHLDAYFRADTVARGACVEGYRRAAGDPAAVLAVDSAVHFDTTRFARITCGVMRRFTPGLDSTAKGTH
jgi:hypothetical protein